MPLYRSDAFVLRTYKLGDNDQIVVFFTQDFGKLRAVVRRNRRARPRSTAYCQPLTHLHVILFGRPSQALFRMNSIDIVEPFRSVHEDFTRLRSGLYMTELIDVATQEREALPELFALMHWGLARLNGGQQADLTLRLIELQLLMHLGYTPQLMFCVGCSCDLSGQDTRFSPQHGGLVCASCAVRLKQTMTMHQETLACLRQAIDTAATSWPQQAMSETVRHELDAILHAHLTTCLGRELKSYAFLNL